MKILFINNVLQDGGAERLLIDILNELATRGFDITVIVFYDTDGNRTLINEKVQYKYIYKISKFRIISKVKHKLFHMFSKSAAYKMYIKARFKENYDVVIGYKSGLPTIMASYWDVNTTAIAWIHEDWMQFHNYKNGYNSKDAEIAIYDKFKLIICPSLSAKNSILKYSSQFINHNIEIVPNCIDISRIVNSLNNEWLKTPEVKIICSVMRLSQEKGVKLLVKSFFEVSKLHDNLELWLIGSGSMKRWVLDYCATNNIRNIKMFGHIDQPYNILKNADIYICSSKTETFGISVLEAMLLEVPVISTMNGGVESYLTDGYNGYLCKYSQQELSIEILKILQADRNIIHEIVLNAKTTAYKFTIENTVNLFLEKVNNILNEGKEKLS